MFLIVSIDFLFCSMRFLLYIYLIIPLSNVAF